MSEKPIKKIIIIGAGISGLTAGIYAQKNGYISEIFERNLTPGGLCTSWDRKGYHLDGCVHWLTGTKPGTELYNLWKDVDAWDDEDVIKDDNFGTIEIDGTPIVLWNDFDKIVEELIEISPEDTKQIKRFSRLANKIVHVPLPYQNSMSTLSLLGKMRTGVGLLPYLPQILYCLTTSTKSYSKKFKNPKLRKFFATILPGTKTNVYQMIYAYATCMWQNGGVPKRGSLAMSKRIANNYADLGGVIHYNSDIQEIIIEKNKAVGVRLKNGECHYADYIVSSTDINHTLKVLLKDQYYSHRFGLRLNNEKKYPAPSCALVSYSVDLEKFNALGITSTYEFPIEPMTVGSSTETTIRLRTYSYDPYFIKDGRVVVNVLVHQDDADYPFWQALNENKARYNEYKKDKALEMKLRIEERFPSLKGDLEYLDFVTPMTFTRYTNAYHGAYMPWGLTHKNSMLLHDGFIRGLHGLVLAGQWLQMPGGLPIALMTGKYAIDRINIREGLINFVKYVKPVNIK